MLPPSLVSCLTAPNVFKDLIMSSAVDYCRLLFYSFGFQQSFKQGTQSQDREFLLKVNPWPQSIVPKRYVEESCSV
jgi:hypothetical protein